VISAEGVAAEVPEYGKFVENEVRRLGRNHPSVRTQFFSEEVDATGLGSGLASFLERTFPGQVLRFLFTQASKSKLGWAFLAIVDTHRFLDWQAEAGVVDERTLFVRQLQACELEVLAGSERRLKWGVPEGRRDPANGELLHDDLVVSAALCARLEELGWGQAQSVVVQALDALEGMREVLGWQYQCHSERSLRGIPINVVSQLHA